jgi:hypothetical protein
LKQDSRHLGRDLLPQPPNNDLGFDFEVRSTGEVAIFHRRRLATILRGQAAQQFVTQANELSDAALQQVMARVTGNYKRGNERTAADHPRNRLR